MEALALGLTAVGCGAGALASLGASCLRAEWCLRPAEELAVRDFFGLGGSRGDGGFAGITAATTSARSCDCFLNSCRMEIPPGKSCPGVISNPFSLSLIHI